MGFLACLLQKVSQSVNILVTNWCLLFALIKYLRTFISFIVISTDILFYFALLLFSPFFGLKSIHSVFALFLNEIENPQNTNNAYLSQTLDIQSQGLLSVKVKVDSHIFHSSHPSPFHCVGNTEGLLFYICCQGRLNSFHLNLDAHFLCVVWIGLVSLRFVLWFLIRTLRRIYCHVGGFKIFI